MAYKQQNSPFKKKKTSKSITWHDSDAPDAKGKFKELSPSSLASWLIKTRKGKLNRIISSLNQQYVFNRGKQHYTISYSYSDTELRNVLSFGSVGQKSRGHQFNLTHKIKNHRVLRTEKSRLFL